MKKVFRTLALLVILVLLVTVPTFAEINDFERDIGSTGFIVKNDTVLSGFNSWTVTITMPFISKGMPLTSSYPASVVNFVQSGKSWRQINIESKRDFVPANFVAQTSYVSSMAYTVNPSAMGVQLKYPIFQAVACAIYIYMI